MIFPVIGPLAKKSHLALRARGAEEVRTVHEHVLSECEGV